MAIALDAVGARPVPIVVEQAQSRLRSIDLLRGAAALLVVLHHAVNAGAIPPAATAWFPAVQAFAELGRAGVPLFFVISGFCIHARWAKQQARGIQEEVPFTRFWKRRLERLYPPYVVALVLSMALVLVEYFREPATPLLAVYPEPRLRWIGLDFVSHLTMLHGLHPVFDRAGGNAPFWTLAREEYFYVLYLPLLFLRRRIGLWASMAVPFALTLLFPLAFRPWVTPGSGWDGVVQSSAITLWVQWCLGLLAVEGAMGVVRLPRWTRSIWLGLLWGALAYAAEHHAPLLAPALWGMLFFTVVNGVVRLERTGRWPDSWLFRSVEAVGLFSYSLYLVHHPIRGLVKRMVAPAILSGDPWQYAWATAAVVGAGCLAGWLFFLGVERRFMRPTTH